MNRWEGAPVAAPNAELTDRLERYSRYAAVVREQILAIQDDDLPRFDELVRARERIQDEVERLPDADLPEGGLDAAGRELLERMRYEVRQAVAADRELLSLIARKRAALAGEVKGLATRGGNARKYLVGDAPSPSEKPSRLNVRL